MILPKWFFMPFLLLITMEAQNTTINYICYDKWPDASPPYHFTPNQCGPNSSLADLIPDRFMTVDIGKACDNHDRCWMELKGQNRYGRCELRLARDLIKACNKAKVCVKIGSFKRCMPNPIGIAACQSSVVPLYTSASIASLFVLRLEKARDEQKKFEKCVNTYGYHKRENMKN